MRSDGRGLVENQIKDWIRQQVCLVDKEHGRCKKLIVRHLNVEKKPDADVHTINLPSDPSVEGTETADRVVLDVAEAGQRDANDLNSGVQTYAVYAYFTGAASYIPRKIFRVAAEDESERDGIGLSEPPNEKGLTAQLMRHNEINSKNSLVAMGYILQTFQKEIQQQREQNRIFLQQQIDMTLLVQETLNDASKRRLEEKQAEIQVSMIEGVFEHLKVALPILANRLAGKEVFPAKMDRELYMLASLLENLSPEQQAMLQNSLKPEQLSILAELLGMYEERKHKFIKSSGEDEKAKEDGGKPKAPGTSNKLLALFEKRSTLVNNEKAVEVEDARTRRIENKADAIRGRLKEVSEKIGKDE